MGWQKEVRRPPVTVNEPEPPPASLRPWSVVVGVATKRPPRIDEFRAYVVWAESWSEARLIACQMASDCVMPVWDGRAEDIEEIKEEWYR